MRNEFHTPVLLQEAINGLQIQAGKNYIDATVGGGGHTFEIVKRGGMVLGIDVDEEAIEYVKLEARSKQSLRSDELKKLEVKNLILVPGNFRDIGEIAREHGFTQVAGILFDLGLSSHLLTTKERGFSFQEEGPLDMRMDKNLSVTAANLVNGLYEHELVYIFEKFGQERMARRIAHAICRAREIKPLETTGELVKIVEKAKKRRGRIHPATQIFQALRIAVNDELGSLEKALPQAVELLESGGRMVVISFHSLEDRIVKRFFREHTLTKKPITPSEEEIARNPRASSAKLRIYEKN